MNSPVLRSITPRKSPATPTGQVTGAGRGPIRCSMSSSSRSTGSRPGRSHLLTKVRAGRPGSAHVEQLQGLRLDALGRVQHHDRGVGCRQHPVGVLGEVAVARGVQQVHDVPP